MKYLLQQQQINLLCISIEHTLTWRVSNEKRTYSQNLIVVFYGSLNSEWSAYGSLVGLYLSHESLASGQMHCSSKSIKIYFSPGICKSHNKDVRYFIKCQRHWWTCVLFLQSSVFYRLELSLTIFLISKLKLSGYFPQ